MTNETLEIDSQAVDALHAQQLEKVHIHVDRMFAVLMALQWLGLILIALIWSPKAWSWDQSHIHLHLVAAILIGGLLAALPIALALLQPGQPKTRYVIAVAQMLTSSLLIHLSGGRIESHFHIFGSLAFLSAYRDWRILVPATLVVAVDHLVRGLYAPYSIYGSFEPTILRSLEHAWWVFFEDIFLVLTCLRAEKEMRAMATHQVELTKNRASLEQTVSALTTILEQVHVAGIQVTGAATSIGAAAMQQQATVSEQAAAAAQIRATTDEISRTSEELAEAMQDMANQSQGTSELANSGNQALAQMQKRMTLMSETTSAVVDKLVLLAQKANGISSVVTAITKVADQTNLLSLNAAIEAQKAGEFGRGFGVVATEIRRLADQTAVATLDIEGIVKDMQASVSSGVSDMTQFRDEMRESAGTAQAIIDQLSRIIARVSDMSASFEQLNLGMKFQNQGASQITISIAQLSESTHQSASAINEFNGIISELQDATHKLQSTVANYRGKSLVP